MNRKKFFIFYPWVALQRGDNGECNRIFVPVKIDTITEYNTFLSSNNSVEKAKNSTL